MVRVARHGQLLGDIRTQSHHLADLSYHSRFCFCPGGIYPEATCFSLASSDKWLLAVLNSPLLWCWLWRKTIHGKDEVLRLKNIYTEQIPVASPTDDMRG